MELTIVHYCKHYEVFNGVSFSRKRSSKSVRFIDTGILVVCIM